MHTDSRKLISNSFDKMHEQLSLIRAHVEECHDPVAQELVESMEFGLLAPMRRLRNHMDIPYDWHEKKSTTQEIAR
jgi:hypothetical protein